jgi:hypothetical protein
METPAFIPSESLTAEQQTAMIATWEGMPDPLGRKPKGSTPQEVAYLQRLLSSQARIDMMPKMPVTVVNLNPYNLVVNHPLFSGLTVKACVDGKRYSALVIRDVKYQVDQGLDRNHVPVEFWPIQLAHEFSTQYEEKGGVFHIHGDLEKNPELAHTSKFKASMQAAESALIVFCRKLKQTADNEWNTPNRSGARNIHPSHRQAAKMLFERKLLSKLPDWMEGNVDLADVTDDCFVCKANTKKGQLVCACSNVLDPFNAFKAGAIDELHYSLERLTRAQVQELGISAYVAETSDEKPARLKSGKPKPASMFEMQQQAALDVELPEAKKKKNAQ